MVWSFLDSFSKTQILEIDFLQYWHKNSIPHHNFLYAVENFLLQKSFHIIYKLISFS